MTVGKKIVIIVSPNGAGKTTFAREFLPFEVECPVFLNADPIAAGLSPFQPKAGARNCTADQYAAGADTQRSAGRGVCGRYEYAEKISLCAGKPIDTNSTRAIRLRSRPSGRLK